MEKDYRGQDVQFVIINSAEKTRSSPWPRRQCGMRSRFLSSKDFGGACGRSLGVKRTPEVVVIDSEKHLRYRGRIDDQYRLGGVRKEATSRDLKDALDAVLAGKKVVNAETEVDGCPITFAKERKPREVTFAENVAPVLQKHCWSCHHTGGSALFR